VPAKDAAQLATLEIAATYAAMPAQVQQPQQQSPQQNPQPQG
jgi:hypothetical protein